MKVRVDRSAGTGAAPVLETNSIDAPRAQVKAIDPDAPITTTSIEKLASPLTLDLLLARRRTVQLSFAGVAAALTRLLQSPKSFEQDLTRLDRRLNAALKELDKLPPAAKVDVPELVRAASEAAQRLPMLIAADKKKARMEKTLASVLEKLEVIASRLAEPLDPLSSLDSMVRAGSACAARDLANVKERAAKQDVLHAPIDVDMEDGRFADALKILPDKRTGKRLGAIAERLAAHGVTMIYCPAVLEEAGSEAGFLRGKKLLFVDTVSMFTGKPSDALLHELRHAGYEIKRDQGIESIFGPVLHSVGRYWTLSDESDIYTTRQAAEELSAWSKTLRHRLRQLRASITEGKIDSDFATAAEWVKKIADQTHDVVTRAQEGISFVLAETNAPAFLEKLGERRLITSRSDSDDEQPAVWLRVPRARIEIPIVSERQKALLASIEASEDAFDAARKDAGVFGRMFGTKGLREAKQNLAATQIALLSSVSESFARLDQIAIATGQDAGTLEQHIAEARKDPEKLTALLDVATKLSNKIATRAIELAPRP